jgi:CRISPR-associated protein Cst1
MYELNKLVKETFGSGNKLEARTKRDILATSVIEYTNKIQTSLGIWTGMNIEIVTKKNDVIEFYSLPYNVIKLITDRKIASLLSDLGEYSIYNKILDENYGGLIDISQKLLKLSTKEQLSTNENNLRNGLLNNWRNQTHLNSTANKILKLYSLIEDKLRRN